LDERLCAPSIYILKDTGNKIRIVSQQN